VRTVAALSRNDYPQGTSVGTSPFGGTDENGDPAGVASLTLAQTPETSIMPVQARTRGIRRGGAVSATGGQQQNTPRMPDLGLRPRPRCDTAAVDERKNGQIDDAAAWPAPVDAACAHRFPMLAAAASAAAEGRGRSGSQDRVTVR